MNSTSDNQPPQIALVHDYLTQRGGAERVFLILAKAFSDAPVYTSLYDPDGTFPGFEATSPICADINRYSMLRSHHRLALPLLARTFSNLTIDAPVTICTSSGWAHGTHATGRKIVYCLSPAHWLYQTDRYFGLGTRSTLFQKSKRMLAKSGFNILQSRKLQRWDQKAAQSAHRYVTSSSAVAAAIKDIYSIDADILPPPPALTPEGPRRPTPDLEPGFLLCVSRLKPYKNVRAIMEAVPLCPDIELVVVGEGPEYESLKNLPQHRIRLLGRVEDDELRWLYANARGLVAASYEDFGLTPLEAATFSKPAAVLRAGGFLDTVIDGRTGLFFNEPVPDEIAAAIRRLFAQTWDHDFISSHAETYSESGFIGRFKDIVAQERAKLTELPPDSQMTKNRIHTESNGHVAHLVPETFDSENLQDRFHAIDPTFSRSNHERRLLADVGDARGHDLGPQEQGLEQQF